MFDDLTENLQTPAPVKEADVPVWLDEADVLVVGYGAAGACTAIEALRADADVLVIERAAGGGGASNIAGGHLYLGGGTPVQQACGFDDTAEEMYKYLMAMVSDPDERKVRLYCDNSVEHFHWLETQGVPFERSYYAGKSAIQLTSECLIWTGNENVWPYRDIAKPAPRGHKVAMEGMEGGSLLMRKLIGKAEEMGVRARYDTGVTALVVDEQQRVVGVQVKHFGDIGHIRARAAVVLTAGGYIMNDEMFEKQLAWMPRDLIKHGTTYDDGSGLLLGLSAGGVGMGLDHAFITSPFYPPAELIKGILVNNRGERFVPEDAYHGRTAMFILGQPEGKAYLIVDSEIFAYPEYDFFEHRLVDGFETVEEMERALVLPLASLQKTVADYNRYAIKGEDPVFHKHPDWLKPLDMDPYAVFDVSATTAKFAGFSLGGLKTSPDSEVLDQSGHPIPGLYAAGASAWNIAQDAAAYSSGTCLGQATFFGRRAGRHAAGVRQ